MNAFSFFRNNEAVYDFCKRYTISYLGLFGSYARHEEKKDSDVDILVEFEKPVTYFTLLAAEEELSQKLHNKVDMVTKKALHPRIKPYIEKDLQKIYEQRS